MKNKQGKHTKNHMTKISNGGKQSQQVATTNNDNQKTTSHMKYKLVQVARKRPVTKKELELLEAIQDITTAITDEMINMKVEETMMEYTGQQLLPKEVAEAQIEKLLEEFRRYNRGELEYTELALIERK